MSVNPLPVAVDVRKAFAREMVVNGAVGLGQLPRFRESLASHSGHVTVRLGFATEGHRQRLIRGDLDAEVEVICQRCLQPMTRKLQEPIRLALLVSESQCVGLDSRWDPWVCRGDRLDLVELVEEQLILALPMVNRHADIHCINRLQYHAPADDPAAELAPTALAGAFAGLAELQRGSKDSGRSLS